MKLALITGGTRGIGKAVADILRKDHTVITVARSSEADETGDLSDSTFRNYLVEKYTPDIFVNNAALLSYNFEQMMQTNGMAAVDLLFKFYNKMSNGTIINVSSISAEKNFLAREPQIRIAYATAKKYLKEVSLSLAYSKNKPIKVMCISPAATDTDMIKPISNNYVPIEEDYTNYNYYTSLCVTRPHEVANIIKWMIDQPEWLVIPELVIDNHYAKSMNW
jgi:NAD(P)-dependent dehydrogenase (short-subunit alcohol dehydrogenase family)